MSVCRQRCARSRAGAGVCVLACRCSLSTARWRLWNEPELLRCARRERARESLARMLVQVTGSIPQLFSLLMVLSTPGCDSRHMISCKDSSKVLPKGHIRVMCLI